MKEILTQFYKKHKTYTFLEKVWRNVPTFKVFFSYIGLASLLLTIAFELFASNIITLNNPNPLFSFLANLAAYFSISFVAILLPAIFSVFVASEQEEAFKSKIKLALMESQSEKEIHHVLEKINLIYFYTLPESDVLAHDSLKHAISQFKNGKFSSAAFNIANDITCESDKLNEYYKKNKELIEMPHEQLLLMTKKRLANVVLKEEQDRLEKIEFIQEYSDLPNKEQAILKLNKKLSMSL